MVDIMTDRIAADRSADQRRAIEDEELVFAVDPSVIARRREARTVLLFRILIGVGALLGWHFASDRLVPDFWISNPLAVLAALVRLWNEGGLGYSIVATVVEALAGFALGALIGIGIGLLFGANRTIARILDPYLVGFYSLPRVALIPLFILWFGIGFQTKVIFTALLVFFPIFMNTLAGARNVNTDLMDVLKVMGASRFDTIRKVLVPSALVWVFAGLHISVPYALIGAVVAEMFTSNVGLGYLISDCANKFDTAGLFATLAVTTVLGLVLSAGVTHLERRLLRWKPEGA